MVANIFKSKVAMAATFEEIQMYVAFYERCSEQEWFSGEGKKEAVADMNRKAAGMEDLQAVVKLWRVCGTEHNYNQFKTLLRVREEVENREQGVQTNTVATQTNDGDEGYTSE